MFNYGSSIRVNSPLLRGARIILALLIALGSISIVPNSGAFASASVAPVLVTDRADYAPGEVVHMSGTGFEPGSYAMPVKRPDGSIVIIDPVTHDATPGWQTASADAAGNLVYG